MYDAFVYNESVYDASLYDTSVYDAPMYDASVYDVSVYDASVHNLSVYDASAYDVFDSGWANGYLRGSHGLSAGRTKSRRASNQKSGPEGSLDFYL